MTTDSEREYLMPELPTLKQERAIIIAGPELSDTKLDEMIEVARRAGVACVAVEPGYVLRLHNVLGGTKIGVYALVGYPHGLARAEIVRQSISWCKTQGACGVLTGFPMGAFLSEDRQPVAELLDGIREELAPANVYLYCSLEGLSIQQLIKAVQFLSVHGYQNIQVPPEALARGSVDSIEASAKGVRLSIGPIRETIKSSNVHRHWFDGSSVRNQNLDCLIDYED